MPPPQDSELAPGTLVIARPGLAEQDVFARAVVADLVLRSPLSRS